MRYLVVGGGVAGVACFLELCRLCPSHSEITLLTASPAVKAASVQARTGRGLEELSVTELTLDALLASARALPRTAAGPCPPLRALRAYLTRIDAAACLAHLAAPAAGAPAPPPPAL